MIKSRNDECGVAVLGVVAHSKKLKFCTDLNFLEGKGPTNGVEHTDVANALIPQVLQWASILTKSVHFFSMTGTGTVIAA